MPLIEHCIRALASEPHEGEGRGSARLASVTSLTGRRHTSLSYLACLSATLLSLCLIHYHACYAMPCLPAPLCYAMPLLCLACLRHYAMLCHCYAIAMPS